MKTLDPRDVERRIRLSGLGDSQVIYESATLRIAYLLQDAAGRGAADVLADVLTIINALREIEHEQWLYANCADEEIGDGEGPAAIEAVWEVAR